ncbi:glycogen debranching protein GlgX [Rhizobiaceae bacterium BDR2-2]|uniref:Glycogen debranching protein GlgX n=1 Tax=Ectorhizobium quercum TaxID=2965071 RepID=A0AAE3MXJ5_9HYPH|nr:glycogen debranching protein GlgX [Ectorhizobium quercum]MCX8996853.1 glycogen debranching protein GlgX [Ectorhizobium quercum]
MTKIPARRGGVELTATGAVFSLWSHHGTAATLCLFDQAGRREALRIPMEQDEDGVFRCYAQGVREGALYGYRVDGDYAPHEGLWFDPAKLLIDPYATAIDRPFVYDAKLGTFGADTAALVPKCVVTADRPVERQPPFFKPGGLIYEVSVKAFTQCHLDVPENLRGTVAALAHPAVIAHLKRIGVDAIELMPVVAWIDERHLQTLGLTNAWGYNPVAFMPLEPRLCPGGMAELRDTVAALHREGIGVILDLVFNHTGEGDRFGPTLSFRGIDNPCLYRHMPGRPGALVNDSGTGNTVACDHPYIRRLIVDSLRHFVLNAGIDGFRFDLATILFRNHAGFNPHSELLEAIRHDEALADRILIAEPWDIGPGGYQLGNFPEPFLEWNDRARDGMRRYWRGDLNMTGPLATILAGSSDVFSNRPEARTRSVNFLAAHDGFTLMDLVSYERKHNEANGERNRDGHSENLSWNNGVEGATARTQVLEHRRRDVMALLSTLFVSRGTVMLTMGDEAGRSQRGNNNAYCQDNEITWFDWSSVDDRIVEHTGFLAALRKRFPALAEPGFFIGDGDAEWVSPSGEAMTPEDWEDPDGSAFGLLIASRDMETGLDSKLAALFNRSQQPCGFLLADGGRYIPLGQDAAQKRGGGGVVVPARSVAFYVWTA